MTKDKWFFFFWYVGFNMFTNISNAEIDAIMKKWFCDPCLKYCGMALYAKYEESYDKLLFCTKEHSDWVVLYCLSIYMQF